ncbi:hypothetical protein BC830DRAFT_1217896 [Chytriomyces sp. MP71]|nr:hypothetical protein BC830DRAFT_1217896 [Chytriomyces sp. MP71]
MFLSSPMRPAVPRATSEHDGASAVAHSMSNNIGRRGTGGGANPLTSDIDSQDYLRTGGLLRGSRAVSFPVSAALPSAGGGMFRIVPATPYTIPEQPHSSNSSNSYTPYDSISGSTMLKAHRERSNLGSNKGVSNNNQIFASGHERGRVVFVKTSRDACDGRQWNSGILREDPSIISKRQALFMSNVDDISARGENVRGWVDPDNAMAARVARLADVYKKDHLDEIRQEFIDSKNALMAAQRTIKNTREHERSAHSPTLSIEDSFAQLTVEDGSRSKTQRLSQNSIRSSSLSRRERELGNHNTSSKLRSNFLPSPKSSDFASTMAILNEPVSFSSDILSSLTYSNHAKCGRQQQHQQHGVVYKSITSLGSGLPPARPDSSQQRVWENVKATLFDRPVSHSGDSSSAPIITPILPISASSLQKGPAPSIFVSSSVLPHSKRRSVTWADLNRDTEYLKKYDVNAIPGLEVGTSPVKMRRRVRE